MKYLAAKAGEALPREAKRRKKDHHWWVSFPAFQLLSIREPYRIDVTNAMEDLVLDPTTIHTVQSIDVIIKQYGPLYPTYNGFIKDSYLS